jgi:aminopeptidase-like protein
MRALITDLAPLRSGTVCDGNDQTVAILREELPFTVHEFASGNEHNGWIVPWKWECQKALIRDADGKVLYDGNAHQLGVASYSDSYDGPVLGGELKRHVFYCDSPGFEDAIIYHCDWWYKPHARSWGFCATKRFHQSIVDDQTYYVHLQTTFDPGTMKVCEYVLPGHSEQSIVLNAHDCHPGCANDDLSGIAVGIEVMRRLAQVPDRRYTYRLIVAPEHYGSIFYLRRYGSTNLRYALFLESLGSHGPLALQASFSGNWPIDRALKNSLRGIEHRVGPFRSIVGNDETCWEAYGHAVPCPSLSRCPFPEYHTSKDSPQIMHDESLNQAADVVTTAMLALDRSVTASACFRGLVCLSNPRYDLYQPYFDPSIPDRRTISEEAKRWNELMNHLPRYFDNCTTSLDLAERFEVPHQRVRDYLDAWEAKGLIRLSPTYPSRLPAGVS